MSQVIAFQSGIDQPAGELQVHASAEQLEPVRDDADASASPVVVSAANGIVLVIAMAVVVLIVKRKWYRLAGSPVRVHSLSPMAAVVLFVGFLIVARLGVHAAAAIGGVDLASAEPRTLEQQARLTLGAYAGQAMVLLAFVIMRNASRSEGVRDVRMSRLNAAMCGGVTMLAVWPIALTVMAIAAALVWLGTGEATQTVSHQTLRLFLESDVSFWWIALSMMVVLVTPLMEEVMYRGVVQGGLVSAGVQRWPAIVITSAAFVMMHVGAVEMHSLAGLFVLSLAFGWAYERTGRLTAPIAMHVVFNGGNLAMAMMATS